ncbi:MAG: PD-(D/E)XK nuclease family protein [Candidatus Aenigmatarchaeota archaeon]
MLKERIDDFYRDKEESRKKRDYFYVSEADDCKRKIYFKMRGAPKEDLEPVVRRKFERGDQIHRGLVSVLYSLGLATASEVETPKDSLFHGRADAVVSINGDNYVVEIKSHNPYSFRNLEEPKSSWYKQLQLYLHYFDMEEGIILVECKGTQELKEFTVERDHDLVKEIFSEFQDLKEKVEKGVIPEKPDGDDWEYNKCNYCEYEEVCENTSGNLNKFTQSS